MNKSLESEVGIGPTFAVLQTDAYSSIDNSPIESSGKGGFEPPHKVLETFMLPLTSFAYLKLVGHKGIEPLSCGP